MTMTAKADGHLLFVVGCWYELWSTTWLLLPWRSSPTSSSSRSRLRPPGISRRPSSGPWGMGHRPSWVWSSQWHLLLQINPCFHCTLLCFGRLAALHNYNIWEVRGRAYMTMSGELGTNQLRAWAKKEYVSVPGGGGSSSVGGGIRDLFGSRSSKSFITWLVLSLLFLRFFSSSRA